VESARRAAAGRRSRPPRGSTCSAVTLACEPVQKVVDNLVRSALVRDDGAKAERVGLSLRLQSGSPEQSAFFLVLRETVLSVSG
jgi:hypothetical protein